MAKQLTPVATVEPETVDETRAPLVPSPEIRERDDGGAPVDRLLRNLPAGLSQRELEQLAAGILKRAGVSGKTPTGKHVAIHAFMRDPRGDEKPLRVAPGTVLDDLDEREIAHLVKHGAIEPEYA